MSLKERLSEAALELDATREKGRVEMEREVQRLRDEAEEEMRKLRADNVDLRSEPSPRPSFLDSRPSTLDPRLPSPQPLTSDLSLSNLNLEP